MRVRLLSVVATTGAFALTVFAASASAGVMLMPVRIVPLSSCNSCGDSTSARHQLAAGDFDGDGSVDLAAIAADDPTSVWLMAGSGDGDIASAVRHAAVPTGIVPGATSLAVGDFNDDGKDDLVTTGAGTTALLEGSASGLGAATSIGSPGVTAAVGDFNGDHHADVATDRLGLSQAIHILLGNGDGTFATEAQYAGSSAVADLVAADFNGDTRDDLAVVTGDESYSWIGGSPESWPVNFLKGAANGVLTDGATVSAPGRPRAATAADINGDGKIDLVLSSTPPFFSGGASALFAAIGGGDLTFGGFTRSTNVGSLGSSVAAAPFDHDAFEDVVAGYDESSCDAADRPTITIASSDGTGSFTTDMYTLCSADVIVSVAPADLDDDGWTDVAGLGFRSGRVVTALNVPSPQPDRTSVDFGSAEVGAQTGSQEVAITNEGAPPLHLTGVRVTGDAAAEFAKGSDSCSGATLEGGAACRVTLTFTPAAVGPRSAALAVSGDGFPDSLTVALTGTGNAPAASAGPSPTPSPGPAASAAARLTLTVGKQAVLRKRQLVVTVGSDKPVKAVVSAWLRSGKKKIATLKPVTVNLQQAKKLRLRLPLSRRTVAAVRLALKRHKRVAARVKVASATPGVKAVVRTVKIVR